MTLSAAEADCAFFDRFVSMIPPEYYFAEDDEEEKSAKKSSRSKKSNKPARPKRHREQYAPDKAKTVTDLQREQAAAAPTAVVESVGVGGSAVNEIEEFRSRLHEKMASLREKRSTTKSYTNPAKKRQKVSKSKAKAAREATAKPKPKPRQKTKEKKPKKKGAKAGAEESLDLAFGELTFSKPTVDELKSGERFQQMRKRKKVDKHAALASVEKFEQTVGTLPVEQAQKALQSDAVAKALKRAEGHKVKDDKTRLRKALAREKREKKQSRVKWGERLQTKKKQEKEGEEQRRLKKKKTKK